jgi:UPF0755 protein
MRKNVSIFIVFLFIIGIIFFIYFYKLLFVDNVNNHPTKKQHVLLVYTGSTYDDVIRSLKKQHVIKNMETFKAVCKKLKYNDHVKPGRYLIKNNYSNLELVRKLRAGNQDPVNITFNNIQNKEQLAEKIAVQIEAKKDAILAEFNNPKLIDSLQLTEDNFSTIFLSNTYEFYWNTNAKQFIQRMFKEYHKFWNEKRINKAKNIGLSPTDVTILASIVQKETTKEDEFPIIAGVYLNRLKINMPLQADPTVLFGLKKLGISRRVTNADLRSDSPYNTYKNTGLPPGPICLPESKTIDGTLDAEEHKYIYFCAKEDFSGYSNFAENWDQHLENARRYQKALNDRKIK